MRIEGNSFMQTKGHNHFPDPDFVGERHFRQNILDEVRERPFAPFHDVVDQGRIDQRYVGVFLLSKEVCSECSLQQLLHLCLQVQQRCEVQNDPQQAKKLYAEGENGKVSKHTTHSAGADPNPAAGSNVSSNT